MHDRLTGRRHLVGDGRTLVGRFAVPEADVGYQLGNQPLHPGSYLAADRTFVIWREGGDEQYTGDFGPHPLPPPILRDNVLATADKLVELRAARRPLSAWLAVPAFVADTDKRLKQHPVEKSMHEHMPYLRNVCRGPHARLRTEHILEPVSRARRITWRSVVHLAASSETWAARRLHGVEPAQLLTQIQVADHDVYENRVVATLVDRLWQHVLARSAELDDIDRWVQRGREFLEAVQSRPSWRGRQRLYNTLGPSLDVEHVDQRIADLRQALDLLRQRLALLRKSPLYRTVRKPYTGPIQLRATNLFLDNGNYRRCRMLWDDWARSYRGGDEAAAHDGALEHWCRSFADYTQLLVLRAIDQLELSIDADTPVPGPGETGLRYVHRGETVAIDRDVDDTFVVRRADRPVLRIVPLPHALTAAAQPDVVDQALRQLAMAREDLNAGPTAVLYPAQPQERDQDRLPIAIRLAVSNITGAEYGGVTLPALVPVGPSDIDSTGRVARLLRAALDAQALLDYPARVVCPTNLAARLALQTPWIEAGAKEVGVLRPPRPSELEDMQTLVAELCRSTPVRQGSTPPDHTRITADLAAAVRRLERLTICPVCSRRADRPDRAFDPRADETYRCECACGSAWELRRCQDARCGVRYPVLIAAGLAEKCGGDDDYLDRVFSQDLLAAPCWTSARAYICPACRYCPEGAASGIRMECVRCRGADSDN